MSAMWADLLMAAACVAFVVAMASSSKPWFWVGTMMAVVSAVGYYA